MSMSQCLEAGGTIADVYETVAKRHKYFCIAIVDSDKHCPAQADNGRTAKRLRKKDSELASPFNMHYYILKETREVENLIPLSIIKQIDSTERIFCLDYFDMKEGLSCREIKNHPETADYWSDLLSKNIGCAKKNNGCKAMHR